MPTEVAVTKYVFIGLITAFFMVLVLFAKPRVPRNRAESEQFERELQEWSDRERDRSLREE